ncbi:MAG: hypothetical protein AVDCRST_MAG68-5130 [uncultured Gemmatimonadetes bacterium]|uniref:Uncharacterized protein n=1 Tax=uncultured Gemmatimonadota bacterium TaxID=203437 RepID=A0A6J4MS62_9BACT|nr:MAG: hypothetical protein AVDCRST_MAG68-5130 [uncultured Gemmatimonadota bacterium]
MARVNLARYGAMIGLLWAAHDLADHVVQTDHQAADKATSWRAMAGHVGGYTAVQCGAIAALSAAARTRLSWPHAVAAVAFSAVSHAFLDRRWPVKRALELTGSPGFARPQTPSVFVDATVDGAAIYSPSGKAPAIGVTRAGPVPLHGPYLADQALHHAALAICAALLAVEAPTERTAL